MRWFVVLLLLLLLVEVKVLSELAGAFGGQLVFLLVAGSGLLGWWLLRRRGLALRRAMAAGAGGDPGALADGLVQIAAGVLLLAPGVISDGLGLLLLLPPVRRAALRQLRRRLLRPGSGGLRMAVFRSATFTGGGPMRGGRIVDREAVVRERPRRDAAREGERDEHPREGDADPPRLHDGGRSGGDGA